MKLFLGKIATSGINKLSLQIRNSVEILATVQSVNLLKELTCPNKEGVYLFHRASLQKCASKIFFLFYSILSHIKFAEKFNFIHLGKISQAALGHLPIFKLATGSMYALSCACTAGDEIRTKGWFKIITSIGKVFITAITLVLEALSIQRTFCTLLLTGTSCTIDIFCLAKNEDLI